MNKHVALAGIAAVLAASAVGADSPTPADEQRPPSDGMSRGNGGQSVEVCFGGLQGGKVIVLADRKFYDDDLETTAKACRIDGGSRQTVPRSPIIPAGSDAIA